jgi:hypothetical protein
MKQNMQALKTNQGFKTYREAHSVQIHFFKLDIFVLFSNFSAASQKQTIRKTPEESAIREGYQNVPSLT